ncbi:MAG: hypothetical protein PHI90_08310 [Clostridia bacterium]|nr:hypothetical protein [Clostridia bacterium]MDD4048802.1 hypothetical protein [Clostridia bacterium]
MMTKEVRTISNNQNGEILIYQSETGETKIDVFMEDGTVWLTQANIAQLYQTTSQNITKHIKHIYEDSELTENRTCNYYSQVQIEGGRSISREISQGVGSISREQMERKVLQEYAIYNTRRLNLPTDDNEDMLEIPEDNDI